jgi:hypothetical protein
MKECFESSKVTTKDQTWTKGQKYCSYAKVKQFKWNSARKLSPLLSVGSTYWTCNTISAIRLRYIDCLESSPWSVLLNHETEFKYISLFCTFVVMNMFAGMNIRFISVVLIVAKELRIISFIFIQFSHNNVRQIHLFPAAYSMPSVNVLR